MASKKNAVAEESMKGSSVSGVSSGKRKTGSGVKPPNAGKAPRSRKTGEWAGPGSVHDERRCRGTARRTGERCKKAAIKGHHYCPSHGGSLPGVAKSAKQRLLELVDPALAELHRVLTDKSADDGVKVRAALGILDRTGFKPGVNISVEVTKFEEVLSDIALDRSLPAAEHPAIGSTREHSATSLGVGAGLSSWEDVDQAARDAQAEAWREHDHEDAEAFERGRIRPDEQTVPGEVVVSRYHRPSDQGPTDPPRYVDEEARAADNPTRTTRIERG